jgi:predicted secreted hydrolase
VNQATTAGKRRCVLPVLALSASLVLVTAACMGPILANPGASSGPGASPAPTRPAAVDPRPIVLPADDAPHDRLTEWWYYTGHLQDRLGHRYGFEYVIFRAERGAFPVSWASHLALTDESAGAFYPAQRSEIGPQVDRSSTGPDAHSGFDLRLDRPVGVIQGPMASGPPSISAEWAMRGSDGHDRLTARATPDEAATAGSPGGLGLDLTLAAVKPPTFHDGDGWIDFGPAGGSYYYSRTALNATGSITVDGRTIEVSGSAWFDHQWGDFISVGGGGWDWFAVNLADGTDLTLSLVRAADGSNPLIYGTIVDAAGRARHLDRSAFTVAVSGRWRSPRTGIDYPSGWIVELREERLRVELEPTVEDQELDTRATTGVVYWEGSQVVRAMRAGTVLGGEAYVELTGYGP